MIVFLRVRYPGEFMEMKNYCSFMVNTFRSSGEFNVNILLARSKINKLYSVVNQNFRNNLEVQKVSM